LSEENIDAVVEMKWDQIATVRDGGIPRIDNSDDRFQALEGTDPRE
jgi:hypothetical protein